MSETAALPPNAFIGAAKPPTERDLQSALGAAKAVWDELLASLAAECGVDSREWKSYSPKWGWSLRLLRRKRTIVWLAPFDGSFLVMFILGNKAVAAARESKLPARILRMLDEAPKYPEGTGLRLQVAARKDLPVVLRLARIKLEH